MPIRYVTQPAAEEGKIIVFPVDDEITFTPTEKEILELAIADIQWDGSSGGFATNSIGFCGDPCVPLDTSVESRLALRKVELILERCDPDYQHKLRSGHGTLYCSLGQAQQRYLIQQNDQHHYPQLASSFACEIAWLKYLIAHH